MPYRGSAKEGWQAGAGGCVRRRHLLRQPLVPLPKLLQLHTAAQVVVSAKLTVLFHDMRHVKEG